MIVHGTLTPALSRYLAGEGVDCSPLLFPSPSGERVRVRGRRRVFVQILTHAITYPIYLFWAKMQSQCCSGIEAVNCPVGV